MRRIYLGVGAVTLATLLIELTLTRIYSVTLYYHFAFMVISVALFGLGLSGVMLYLRPERHPEARLAEQLAQYSRRFALSTVLALVYIVNHSLGSLGSPLDPLQAPTFGWQHFFQLTFLYLFSALPFYFGGMVVSLSLHHLRDKAPTVYFFDLLGASLGCLLLDPLLRLLGGPSAVLAAATLAALGAVIFDGDLSRWRPTLRSWAVLAGLGVLLAVNLVAAPIRVGSFKWVKNQHLAFSKWNAISRIEVQERKGDRPDMTIDGQARTLVATAKVINRKAPRATITSLVHAVRPKGRMLIIGPGGGIDVALALEHGHEEIHLAEINPTILYNVMLGKYLEASGRLYKQPGVHPHLSEGRHFVRTTKLSFKVIQATLVDTWAATASGAFSLSENHLYTVEAFEDYLKRLDSDGIVTMSRWVHVPGMEFLRLGSLAREALERIGVKRPVLHTYAAYTGRLATLLVKRTPFTKAELARLDQFCKQNKYVPLYRPYVRIAGPLFHILGPADRKSFYEKFHIDVRPVFDDQPFFFQAIKPERMMRDLLRVEEMGLNSFGLQIVLAMLVLVTVLVFSALVVPLWLRRRAEKRAQGASEDGQGGPGHDNAEGGVLSKLRDVLYFACLGVGFIVVEIALLQKFTLLLGHPITSLQVVFFGMLLFTGIGSLLSGRVRSERPVWLLIGAAAGTMLLTIVYSFTLGSVVSAAIAWSAGARIAMSLLLVALPALLMGMLLPTGIRLLSKRHPEIIPWAWGVNGAASVMGSVVAMFLALAVGFATLLLIGGGIYGLALLLGARR
jgi:spermidine synthase